MSSDPISIVVAPRSLAAIKLWDEVLPFNSGTVTSEAQAVVLAAKSVTLDFLPGDTAVFSSTLDWTGPILADNFITINGVIGPEPVTTTPAVDVSASIPIGITTVVFEWRDFGGLAQTSDIYLVTTAKIFE